jgi:hypothetical protein
MVWSALDTRQTRITVWRMPALLQYTASSHVVLDGIRCRLAIATFITKIVLPNTSCLLEFDAVWRMPPLLQVFLSTLCLIEFDAVWRMPPLLQNSAF